MIQSYLAAVCNSVIAISTNIERLDVFVCFAVSGPLEYVSLSGLAHLCTIWRGLLWLSRHACLHVTSFHTV